MNRANNFRAAVALASTALLVSCGGSREPAASPRVDAPTFVSGVNKDLVELNKEANAAGWTQSTYITADTQYLNAKVTERYLEYFSRKAEESKVYDGQKLDPSTARSIKLISG